jgi:uroporphyrinogen-III decarboxylase
MHRDPALFAFLMERITEVTCDYTELQVEESSSACSSLSCGLVI